MILQQDKRKCPPLSHSDLVFYVEKSDVRMIYGMYSIVHTTVANRIYTVLREGYSHVPRDYVEY